MKSQISSAPLAWAHVLSTSCDRLLRASDTLQKEEARYVVARQALTPKRRLPTWLIENLPAVDWRNIRITVAADSGREGMRRVSIPAPYAQLVPRDARDALAEMAATHARLTGASVVFGRIAVFCGTPCPRWHVDKVRLRGLCSLHGPGCVLQDDSVREGEVCLRAGDAVFMYGAGVDDPAPPRTFLSAGAGWGFGFGVGVGPFFGIGISLTPSTVLFGAGAGAGLYCGAGFGAGAIVGIGATFIPVGVSTAVFYNPRLDTLEDLVQHPPRSVVRFGAALADLIRRGAGVARSALRRSPSAPPRLYDGRAPAPPPNHHDDVSVQPRFLIEM